MNEPPDPSLEALLDTGPPSGVDELYAASPEEFVARRQGLVKQLKAAGDRQRAADVASLRRPTVAAWAVNQLARRHPDELGRLFDLGRELEEAHERLLGGGRPESAVTSGRRRREAIAALTDRAMALLAESGHAADSHRVAVADTLDAASVDPGAAAAVRAGRLTRELDPPSGFGLDWIGTDWTPPPRRPVDVGAAANADDGDDTEEVARREAEAATAARAAAKVAQGQAVHASRAAAEAEHEVERLEEELEKARATASLARRAAADAAAQARKTAARAAAHAELAPETGISPG